MSCVRFLYSPKYYFNIRICIMNELSVAKMKYSANFLWFPMKIVRVSSSKLIIELLRLCYMIHMFINYQSRQLKSFSEYHTTRRSQLWKLLF